MIRKRTDDAHLVEPPFFATAEPTLDDSSGRETGEGVVSFAKGKIFHCYNSFYDRQDEQLKAQNERKYFSKGADWHYPTNIDESFTYKAGDKFYLKLDKEGQNSEILKVEEESEIDLDGHILIWQVVEIASLGAGDAEEQEFVGTQFLSKNVFLQNTQEFRQMAFASNLLEEKQNGDKRYRMNGGWVCIFNKGIVKFIDSFEYTVKSNEESFYYIEIDVRITERSSKDTIKYANRRYIKDFEVVQIKVVRRNREITDEEREDSQAYILGNSCRDGGNSASGLTGKYWVDLPTEGNININLEVVNAPTRLLSAAIVDFDADENFVVSSITFSARVNLSDAKKCAKELPETLIISKGFIEIGMPPNFLDKFEAYPFEEELPHNGDGTYGPKTFTIPENVNLLTEDDGHSIVVNESSPCDVFLDKGVWSEIDITGIINKKTSFITMVQPFS